MAKIFESRGRFKAHYATGAEQGYYYARTGAAYYPTEETVATSGVFGGALIDITQLTANNGVGWPGLDNWPSTNKLSYRIRFVPNWSGNPSISQVLLFAGDVDAFNNCGGWIYIQTNGKIGVQIATDTFINAINSEVTLDTALSFTSGVPTEIMLTYDGDDGALKISQDGVEVYSGSGNTFTTRNNQVVPLIQVGYISGITAGTDFKINNVEIWDTIENHVYTARTDFDSTVVKQPLTCTDPNILYVAVGTTYYFQGNLMSGAAELVDNTPIPEGGTFAPSETQKAIYEILSEDDTIIDLLGEDSGTDDVSSKVFDHVPDNSVYPYITLQVLPWTDRGSHTYEGLETEFQIDVWYRSPGRGTKQVQAIQKRIDELLHKRQICVYGWNTNLMRRTYIDIVTEDDNVTHNGIQRFKLFLGEG